MLSKISGADVAKLANLPIPDGSTADIFVGLPAFAGLPGTGRGSIIDKLLNASDRELIELAIRPENVVPKYPDLAARLKLAYKRAGWTSPADDPASNLDSAGGSIDTETI
jgi:hypothetical protein